MKKMTYSFKTEGVCAKEINFDLIEGKVRNIEFTSGCPGNLKGIALLAEGMTPEEIKERLSGISCGPRPSSCPDQLSKAMDELV